MTRRTRTRSLSLRYSTQNSKNPGIIAATAVITAAAICICLSVMACVSLPDPRIRHRIQHVCQKVHRDIRQSNRQDAALDQIVIAVRDGLDGEAADAGPGEDSF